MLFKYCNVSILIVLNLLLLANISLKTVLVQNKKKKELIIG